MNNRTVVIIGIICGILLLGNIAYTVLLDLRTLPLIQIAKPVNAPSFNILGDLQSIDIQNGILTLKPAGTVTFQGKPLSTVQIRFDAKTVAVDDMTLPPNVLPPQSAPAGISATQGQIPNSAANLPQPATKPATLADLAIGKEINVAAEVKQNNELWTQRINIITRRQ